MAHANGSPAGTPASRLAAAGAKSSVGSPAAATATPSPASRIRPRAPPVVPVRAVSQSESMSPATKAPSGLPRTRKSSIPRLSTGSPMSAPPPPMPTTPASQIRRSRRSGNVDPVTPKTPTARVSHSKPQTQPLPSLSRESSQPAERRASPPATFAEAEVQPSPQALREVEVSRKANYSGAGNENGHERHDGQGHTGGIAWEDELRRAKQKADDLEVQYRLLQAEHSRCNPRLERPMRALRQEGYEGVDDKFLALLLDREVLGTVVRSLPRDQRMALLGVIAEACRPSDIQAQIEMLQRYKEMRTGVLARLDDNMCLEVLRLLGRADVLSLRLVSKRFDRLSTSPKLWKPMCRELEARWDGTIDLSNYHLDDNGDWLGLYKSLWQREKHWTNGQAQTLALLSGHTNYVTSLKLCGETLISASYDDTIRIWHLPYVIAKSSSVSQPIVIPAKSVSSLDYYAPEGVLVTGSHEVGRASVWRQFDGEWKVERILSGHLHGTRAVAINAQWLVSVGSDKAIVVWDWRNGAKVVRFGQQTNVCVGMNLLDNFIITATVDGIIRTFSIAKREMLGQFKLSDMALRHPEYADKLKDVGVGALGMLTWFTAEGRFLACATKDIVIRLAWDWAGPEEQVELAEGIESPTKVSFPESQSTTPITPVASKARASLGHAHSSRPSSPRSPPTPLQRGPPAGTPLSSKLAHGGNERQDTSATPTTTNTTSKFALARWPTIVEVLDITGTERGAFEAGRVRIATSRRLSARAGAERRVLVGTEHPSPDGKANMQLVPLGGVWDSIGRQAGLQASSKNPMSLALDHDKLVYGCSDGSIVVAGFIAPSRSPQRSPPKRG